MKKVLALLTAVLLIAALGVTAFAGVDVGEETPERVNNSPIHQIPEENPQTGANTALGMGTLLVFIGGAAAVSYYINKKK